MSGDGKAGSVRILSCVYGPSGNDAHGTGPVTIRFVRRFGDNQCGACRNISFETLGKSISRVSSVSEFLWSEEHSLAGGKRVIEHASMAGHMRLNHYMAKSREEFYSRICGSRYFFK